VNSYLKTPHFGSNSSTNQYGLICKCRFVVQDQTVQCGSHAFEFIEYLKMNCICSRISCLHGSIGLLTQYWNHQIQMFAKISNLAKQTRRTYWENWNL